MNKIIPIANIVVSIIALIISVCGITFSALSSAIPLFAVFAIVLVVIGFTISAVNCGFGFAFIKSKLCIIGGTISAISLFINIAAFIILI